MGSCVYQRNVWLCLGIPFTMGAVMLSIPSIVGYWQAKGMNFQEITALQVIFAASVVLLEVPTGYLADCLGRKRSLVWGALAMTVGEVAYATAQEFWGFALAEVLVALGNALWSGADQAFIRSSLRAAGKESEFTSTWARQQSICFYAMAGGGAFGGWLATVNPRLPLWMAVAVAAGALVSTLFMVEPPGSTQEGRHPSLKDFIRVVQTSVLTSSSICWLLLFSGAISAWLRVSVWLYQPYFEICKLSLFEIGLVFAAFNLVAGVSSEHLGSRWSTHQARWGLVLWLCFFAYVVMGTTSTTHGGWLIACVHQVVRGITSVAFASLIKTKVNEKDHGTIASLQSFSGTAIYGAFLPLVGSAADGVGVMNTFLWIGIFGLAINFVMLKVKPIEQ